MGFLMNDFYIPEVEHYERWPKCPGNKYCLCLKTGAR